MSGLINNIDGLDYNFFRITSILTVAEVRGIIGFSCGTISYCIYDKIMNHVRYDNIVIYTILESVSLLGILYCYVSKSYMDQYIAIIFFSSFMILLALNRGYLSNFMSLNMFTIFGSLSYCIYLIHPIIMLLGHSIFIYLLEVIGVSFVLTKFYEQPVIKKLKMNLYNN